MQRIYLKDRSFTIDSLPSEISLLVELMDLCHNDEATFEMFSAAIRRDSGLTAKFIKIANSPLYRQWNEISDIKRMLIVLGMTNVKKVIITSAVQQFFSKSVKGTDKNIHHLWLRSLVCAHLAEKIARHVNYPKVEEAYLAGLLHQIGILLLLVNYGDKYQKILDRYDSTGDFRDLEKTNFGIDHCEVGAALIESWKLDSLMSDAILFQGAGEKELSSSPVLLKILSVARGLASPLDIDVEKREIDKADSLLKLPQDTTLECLAEALDESRNILSELGLADNVCFAEAKETSVDREKREQKVADLSERIQNIALAYCFISGESQNSESFIKELRVNFDLLFSLKQLIFFRLDAAAGSLVPFNDLQLGKLDEINFRLADQYSGIVQCFNRRSAVDTSTHPCTIADNQIIRIMGTDCAYFLPVWTKEKSLGVLAVGIARRELVVFKEKLPLIDLLISEISQKYFAISQAEEPTSFISMTDFNKIVHEVRNPLTIINNYLYILGRKLDDDHPAKEEIDFIKEEMERVGLILAKARDQEQQVTGRSKTDINMLLEDLNNFFCSSLYGDKSISSSLALDAEIPLLLLPENKLKQVFINIIKNAVEALPENGIIEITTRDNCFQNGNQFVEISIKDNGPGIPNEVLKNLFNPVESTKKGHSGLGLSIVRDLINEISGTIFCYSSREMGTEFRILFPRRTLEPKAH